MYLLLNTFKNTAIDFLRHFRISLLVILISRLVPPISTLFWYFVIATKRNISYSFLIIEWYTHSFHFTIKTECEKSLMCAQVYTYAQLCSDKNAHKKDNSLLDLFGIFSQSLIKWLVSQQINRLPHVNFVLPNSCVNILYHTVSLKFSILFCDCVIFHFLRAQIKSFPLWD